MRRVFIVDDNIELLRLYEFVLSDKGMYDIAGTASGGKDALNAFIAMDIKPDLIIIDINMPDMDGIETALKILRHGKPGFIFATAGNINPADIPPELSGSPILRKPFSMTMLLYTVDMHLNRNVDEEYVIS